MERSLLPESTANGGFPEPPAGEPIRVVATLHGACGSRTRVRLPEKLPAQTVRRLRCQGCEQVFEAEVVEELEVEQVAPRGLEPAPAGPLARWMPAGFDPEGRGWKLASIPIAAAAVIAALLLLQGGDESEPVASDSPPAAEQQAGAEAPALPPPPANGDEPAPSKPTDRAGSKKTKFVEGSSYSLALPAGWQRVSPSGGATFAAVAAGGEADVTLWIEEDPKLDFPTFINQSLVQLESLAGSARIVERVPAPTPEATIVRLAADAPEGQPSYEVTLRAAGPYRYYLATSVQPDASAEAVRGAELVAGSFTPEASSGSGD